VQCLSAGDALYLRQGSYGVLSSNSNPDIPSGTSWSDPVIIASYPGETATVQNILLGYGLTSDTSHYQPSYIIFDGLIIDGSAYNVDVVGISHGAHHIKFINNEIINGWGGVDIRKGNNNNLNSEYNEFISNRIHHNGRFNCGSEGTAGGETGPPLPAGEGCAHGLYISSGNNLFDGNVIYSNGEYGLHIYTHPGDSVPGYTANNNVARNNIIFSNNGNTTRYGSPAGQGMLLGGGGNEWGTGLVAYNNIIFDNPGGGLQVGNAASGALVQNNIVLRNASGINLSTQINADIRDNLMDLPIVDHGGGGYTESNNTIGGDPLFINVWDGDFSILPGNNLITNNMTVSEVLNIIRNSI